MDYRDEKSALRSAGNYDFDKFLFDVRFFDETTYESVLKKFFRTKPEQIYTHDKARREKRNKFFERILVFAQAKRYSKVVELMFDKQCVVSYAEEFFDEIINAIERADLNQCDCSQKMWSLVFRMEHDLRQLYEDTNTKIAEDIKGDGALNLGLIGRLRSEYGGDFDPDSAAEQMVAATSLALKLLAYKENLYVGQKLKVPPVVEVDMRLCEDAGELQYLALTWKRLLDVANRCVVLGGKASRYIGSDVPLSAAKNGIEVSSHFEPTFSQFEIMDFISSHRAVDGQSHRFFELALNKQIEHALVENVEDIRSLDDGQFLSVDEVNALLQLSELYSTDFFDSKIECFGLTIREWARAYSCLKYHVQNKSALGKLNVFHKADLGDTFIAGGLPEAKVGTAIENLIFGKNSRDLYDTPLLALPNDYYYLSATVVGALSIYSTLISLLSSLGDEWFDSGKKGKGFEKRVLDELNSRGVNAKPISFKREEEFECDVVFVMQNKIFVGECKNRTIPCWNPVRGGRFYESLNSFSLQVRRQVKGLRDNPEVVGEVFGVDPKDFEFVPFILFSQPVLVNRSGHISLPLYG
ncbi:hypothetical protein [Marinagarivorans cellulosilyticus]|uniref:NERD domain-containing protein n=1 Tax=Marinagarivorans cellulosilyticus TaxID=2721545 RepID=A0AAN2BIU0_9GAMM|nr:hypothetical protein [Marinagarivorans cellulosilyticus]BCD96272.1 hypothetical protein MARGE09_P0472 [Marinagarivorans cellulosilyticus]